MPRRILLLATALAGLTESAGAADHQVSARAIGAIPQPPIVSFIARHSKARTVNAAEHALYKDMTVSEVVTELCGTVQDGYLEELALQNPSLTLTVDSKMGNQVYAMAWPACLRVRKDVKLTVRRGDSLSSIRLFATGEYAVGSDLDAYFKDTGIGRGLPLPIRRQVVLPFETLPTKLIVSETEFAGFAAGLRTAGGRNVAVDDQFKPSGVLIGPYKPVGTIAIAGVDCSADDDGPWPYNAGEVASAYEAIKKSQQTVTVAIVDNGFFGVPCTSAGCPPIGEDNIAFATRFPRQVFAVPELYSGNMSTYGPIYPLAPLNYGKTPPLSVNDISGHGTHVAGLVLGGPAFEDYRDRITDKISGESRITISIIALARGTDTLDPGADDGLRAGIEALRSPDIVNMSIAFDDQVAAKAPKIFAKLFSDHQNTLFIAAAGNAVNGNLPVDLDQGRYYPAFSGGPAAFNVMTVASIDANGRLSDFSNYGDKVVDVAAPGCRILSWLNAEGLPVPLSGTSQAAPLVSFAAALMRTKWYLASPLAVKNRLIASGDVIKDEASRARVASGVALNIQKALFFPWDYLAYSRNGESVRLLGKISRFNGVSCGAAAKDFNVVRSLKRQGDRLFVYTAVTEGPVVMCEGQLAEQIDPANRNTLFFQPQFELIGAAPVPYTPPPGTPPGATLEIDSSTLTELVLRAPS